MNNCFAAEPFGTRIYFMVTYSINSKKKKEINKEKKKKRERSYFD